jgi:hypothetical protein
MAQGIIGEPSGCSIELLGPISHRVKNIFQVMTQINVCGLQF